MATAVDKWMPQLSSHPPNYPAEACQGRNAQTSHTAINNPLQSMHGYTGLSAIWGLCANMQCCFCSNLQKTPISWLNMSLFMSHL